MFEKWQEILLGSEDEQNSTQSLEHNAHAWSVLFCLQRSLFCLQHSLFCCSDHFFVCSDHFFVCRVHFFVWSNHFFVCSIFFFQRSSFYLQHVFYLQRSLFFLCSDCFFFAAFLFLCSESLVGHRTIPMIWPSKLFNEPHLNTPELIYPRSELWKLTISQFFPLGLSHV